MPLDKPEKLYVRVQRLVDLLNENRSLQIHSKINEFYYMQKIEELKQLDESIKSAYKSITAERERLESLKHNYDAEYTELFNSWKKDVRWINKFKLELEIKT